MDRVIVHALTDGFRDNINSLVVHNLHALQQFLRRKRREVIAAQTVHMLFQRADRLHQGALEIIADTHHLARGLHLGG